MTTYTFEEVKRGGRKVARCTVCEKRIVRSRTFRMTLNPWNVNPDGSVRSYGDIVRALADKITAWQAEPETHAKCEEPPRD